MKNAIEIKRELINNKVGENATMEKFQVTYKGYTIQKIERIDSSEWKIISTYMREKQECNLIKTYTKGSDFDKALNRIIKK